MDRLAFSIVSLGLHTHFVELALVVWAVKLWFNGSVKQVGLEIKAIFL